MTLPGRARMATAILTLVVVLFFPHLGRGQEANRIGTVLVVEGAVEVRAQNATAWEGLRFRDAIFLNDTVRTAEGSKVKVLLRDDSIITLAEQSEMQFTELLLTQQQRRTIMSLFIGKVRVLTTRIFGAGSATEVRTPNAVAGVRGSEENVQYDNAAQKTRVLCVSASVEDSCYIRDPEDPTRFLNVPEGHLAEQLGIELPTSTRLATPVERQEIVRGTAAITQIPGAVQTAAQLEQSQIAEPSTRSDISPPVPIARELASVLPQVSTNVQQAGQLEQVEFRQITNLPSPNLTPGDDPANIDLPGVGQSILPLDNNPIGTDFVKDATLSLTIVLPQSQ